MGSKHKLLEEKIKKVMELQRKLERDVKVVKWREQRELKIAKQQWLHEKILSHKARFFGKRRAMIEHKVRKLKSWLRRLKSKARKQIHRRTALRRKIKLIERNGEVELMREKARFKLVVKQEAAKQRKFRTMLRKLGRDVIKERIEAKRRFMEERSRQRHRARVWAAKQALKMHRMRAREGELIVRLKKSVLMERRKLVKEKIHWRRELAKLKARETNHVHALRTRIHDLKLEIRTKWRAGKLAKKQFNAKWNHKIAMWKKRARASLRKLNHIRVHDVLRLRRERLEVERERRVYRLLKRDLLKEKHLFRKELHREGGLKRRRAWWFKRLKHAKWSVGKFSRMLLVERRTLRIAHREQDKLAKAIKALKRKHSRWEHLKKKQDLVRKQLKHWRMKVIWIKKKMVAERWRARKVGREATHTLLEYRSKLRHVISIKDILKQKWVKGMKKLEWMRSKLVKLKKAQRRERGRVAQQVAKVKHLTLEVRHVRYVIVRLKVEVRHEIMKLAKYKQLVKSMRGGVRLLKSRLWHAKKRLRAESQKERHVLLRIRQEREHTNRNKLELRKLRARFKLMMREEKWSRHHERRINKELKFDNKQIRRIQAKLIAENRRFSLRLGQKRRREAALQRRVLRKIHRLVHELKMEQSGIKKLAKEKEVALQARAKLLSRLRVEEEDKKKEHESMLIFEKEHKALLILERKFAIQQKLILHLRRLYSCGKLQKLARKERKYSFLLRREGRRLEDLVHKLYTVEGKGSHFSKTLRKHHAKWEEGAIQRRRELKRAEMYLKWAHRMIKDHRW